jgi:hypothetical protein
MTNNSNLIKIAVPAIVGLALAGGVVSWWVSEIMNSSYRTGGTLFSKYATVYPTIKNPSPSEAPFCDPAYKLRWVGCSLK